MEWMPVPTGVNGADGESVQPAAVAVSAVDDDSVTRATTRTAKATSEKSELATTLNVPTGPANGVSGPNALQHAAEAKQLESDTVQQATTPTALAMPWKLKYAAMSTVPNLANGLVGANVPSAAVAMDHDNEDAFAALDKQLIALATTLKLKFVANKNAQFTRFGHSGLNVLEHAAATDSDHVIDLVQLAKQLIAEARGHQENGNYVAKNRAQHGTCGVNGTSALLHAASARLIDTEIAPPASWPTASVIPSNKNLASAAPVQLKHQKL